MLGSLIRQLFRGKAGQGPAVLKQAVALQEQGRHGDAERIARTVLATDAKNPGALSVLAAALCAQGKAREGIACLRRIIEVDPGAAAAHANLATVLAAVGDFDAAVAHYRSALALQPGHAGCAEQLGRLLKLLARYDEAEACVRAALAAGADAPGLRQVLASALFEQGWVDRAIVESRAALAQNPDMPAAHSDLVRMLNYADGLSPEEIYREHAAWGARHAAPLERIAAPHDNAPDPARRLRVGFVSPYFRKHAMNFFFESTVEFLQRDRFEITLYADVAQPDDYSERLKGYGAAWRSTVGASDARLAAMAREDRVDILVDLSGHTPGNRLLAFARRAAPVQVTWNGYPNTTGMSAMDFRITDEFCDPPGQTEHLHSERLARLPRIFMTWRPPADAPDVAPPPALAAGHVTFGSFNSCFKITPALAALWARVLAAVPGSRLMLVTIGAGAAERRVRDLFAAHGIGAERLEILPRMTHEEFLMSHARADIALDSYPYHGTTTTCFSLWMGLPVVTLAGATHVSRVGVSLLTNAGLPDLVARDPDHYVEIARRIAGDLSALAALRAGLRGRILTSPLADGRAGARAFERAFRDMWSAWCSRQSQPNQN